MRAIPLSTFRARFWILQGIKAPMRGSSKRGRADHVAKHGLASGTRVGTEFGVLQSADVPVEASDEVRATTADPTDCWMDGTLVRKRFDLRSTG